MSWSSKEACSLKEDAFAAMDFLHVWEDPMLNNPNQSALIRACQKLC